MNQLRSKIMFAPAKAANAGGVAISGLEMSQNSLRLSWTKEEMQIRLKDIMRDIHNQWFSMALRAVASVWIMSLEPISPALYAPQTLCWRTAFDALPSSGNIRNLRIHSGASCPKKDCFFKASKT